MQNYNPKAIEEKWQKYWLENKTFKTIDDSKKKKFYCLDMFPYPSGAGLHVGHPEGYTATDIYSRYLRANNYNVLHPMGWDAFGLPAENYAIKQGVHPQETTQKNIANFKRQIQMLGFSYDWDREINTSDPNYYKWTQWLFLQLFKKGLAYQKMAPVNWCNSCQTVLAREQVVDGKCERCKNPVVQKELKQWFFKITDYADKLLDGLKDLDWPENIKLMQTNWIGKSEGALISFQLSTNSSKLKEKLDVFTTRPDTLFGATYMVIAPEHKLIADNCKLITNYSEIKKYVARASHKSELERTDLAKDKTGVEIKGIKAINPANGKELPIFVADYVLSSYGTGAIMAVPAHDERDNEFAKKYNLPIIEVVAPFLKTDARDDKKTKVRTMIQAMVFSEDSKKVLCIKWKNGGWGSFVMGGVEDNEDIIKASKREIAEETGYTDVELVEQLDGEVHALYFANHKDENRYAKIKGLIFKLKSKKTIARNIEDKKQSEVHWINTDAVSEFVKTSPSQLFFWDKYYNKKIFTDAGILINSGKFDGMDSKKAKVEITKFVKGKLTTNYRLRDWLVSRQRYWGAPIPIIHCKKCGAVAISEEDLPAILPQDVDFRPTGESPLARSVSFNKNVICPKCGSKAEREPDTMDTFVCSSWYYLAYTLGIKNLKLKIKNFGNKQFKKLLNQWMPVDLYIGGAEHAVMHLLYARFICKFLFDNGYVNQIEPFIKLRNQGMILASDGRKMSKSLGNVINPDDVVKEFGADSFRLYEMFMGPLEDGKNWDTKNITGVRRFLENVWKFSQLPDRDGDEIILKKTINKVTDDIKNLRFNTAISAMMVYINNALSGKTKICNQSKEEFAKILSPFAPHIAEEIWQNLGHKESISKSSWPKTEEIIESKKVIAIQINGKVRLSIEIDAKLNQKQVEELALSNSIIKKWLNGGTPKKMIYIPGKILSIVI